MTSRENRFARAGRLFAFAAMLWGCSDSSDSGSRPDLVEVPRSYEGKICNAQYLNDDSQVLLLCVDPEVSGAVALVQWSFEKGFREFPPLPGGCDPLSIFPVGFAKGDQALINAHCPDLQPETLFGTTALLFRGGRWLPLKHASSYISDDGQYQAAASAVGSGLVITRTLEEIPLHPFPPGITSLYPTAINNSGVAVGGATYGDLSRAFFQFYGFAVSKDSAQLIAPLARPELSSSFAYDISNDGTILLSSSTDRSVEAPYSVLKIGVSRAALVKPNGEWIEVGPEDLLIQTEGRRINDRGVAIGDSYDSRKEVFEPDPFFFSEQGGFVRVREVFPPDFDHLHSACRP